MTAGVALLPVTMQEAGEEQPQVLVCLLNLRDEAQDDKPDKECDHDAGADQGE